MIKAFYEWVWHMTQVRIAHRLFVDGRNHHHHNRSSWRKAKLLHCIYAFVPFFSHSLCFANRDSNVTRQHISIAARSTLVIFCLVKRPLRFLARARTHTHLALIGVHTHGFHTGCWRFGFCCCCCNWTKWGTSIRGTGRQNELLVFFSSSLCETNKHQQNIIE